MSFYDLDINQNVVELLPPDKRYQKNVALITALLKPLQWLQNLIFNSYRTGSTAPNYAPGTWNKYQQVIYNKKVYESLIDSNIDLPTVVTSWQLVQDDFIGVEERVLYSCQKIILEYALNHEFNSVFRQPPNVSDIYITVNTKPFEAFVVGANEYESSAVFGVETNSVVINDYSFGSFYNYTIYIPAAVYTAINSNAGLAEKTVRNFVDKYNAIGLFYNIITY